MAPQKSSRPPLRPDMTVRQVAHDYPGCREVFRRLGEPDNRPAKFGHLEPLDCFARRLGLPLAQLLEELAGKAGVGLEAHQRTLDAIHRPFIAWALAITLTLGAGWGALLLFDIGNDGTFAAIADAHVVAHGETQLWGFVGLFIAGIALRFMPMTTAGLRPASWLRRTVLFLWLSGVLGGFAWAMAPGFLGILGPVSGMALLAAALALLAFAIRQLAGKLRTTWAPAMLASFLWLTLWAGVTMTARFYCAFSGPGQYSQALRLLLMELAIFGFILNAIYGFGQKLLSGFLGSAAPRWKWIAAAMAWHNLGVLALILAHLEQLAGIQVVGAFGIAGGAFCFAIGYRGFLRVRHTITRPETGERFLDRYIQLAFVWLIIGLGMLVLGELYWAWPAARPPHAYIGAVRHALTVGFVTTLILGVGQRLLPVLGHTLLAWPGLVLPVFILIAVGNLWRVITEVLTLYYPVAFAVMPYSAIMEMAALGLFSGNAWGTLWPAADPLLRTGQAAARTSVAVLLAHHPWLEDVLYGAGLGYIGRVRSVPQELTLGTLVESEGQDVAKMIKWINDLLREKKP